MGGFEERLCCIRLQEKKVFHMNIVNAGARLDTTTRLDANLAAAAPSRIYAYFSPSAFVPRAHEVVASLDHRHPVLTTRCAHRVSNARPRDRCGTGRCRCRPKSWGWWRRELEHARAHMTILRSLRPIQYGDGTGLAPGPMSGGKRRVIDRRITVGRVPYLHRSGKAVHSY